MKKRTVSIAALFRHIYSFPYKNRAEKKGNSSKKSIYTIKVQLSQKVTHELLLTTFEALKIS